MEIILIKDIYKKASINFFLHLLKEFGIESNYTFYYQSYKDDKVLYTRIDLNDERLDTINPNILDNILIAKNDFGKEFTSNFNYTVQSYVLNDINYYKKDKEYPEIVNYTTISKELSQRLFSTLPDWRTNEKLITIIKDSLKDFDPKTYFRHHSFRVTKVPDDVKWKLVCDEAYEYIKEDMEVREWH